MFAVQPFFTDSGPLLLKKLFSVEIHTRRNQITLGHRKAFPDDA
jgi:hypothetical protein